MKIPVSGLSTRSAISSRIFSVDAAQAAACVLFVALLAGCAAEGPRERGPVSPDDPLGVVTTTSMIADLVRIVGGDLVRVDGLMGPGVDPHLYQASQGDVSRMAGADVVFYNGLHLEGKMVEIFEQMHERGQHVFAVTDAISEEERLQSELFTGNYDPHIWFDLTLWQKAARYAGDRLAEVDAPNGDAYRSRAAAFADSLGSLDREIRLELDRIPDELRVLITSHDAFGYFGRAYGFDVRGLQGISTATEAGTADVQDLAAFVAERRIPAMFIESSISPRGIEAVREAVRARGFDVEIGGTLYGDALGPEGSGADTFVGMVRANTATIAHGLGGAVEPTAPSE